MHISFQSSYRFWGLLYSLFALFLKTIQGNMGTQEYLCA